jgi:hypothetical protein
MCSTAGNIICAGTQQQQGMGFTKPVAFGDDRTSKLEKKTIYLKILYN